MFLGFLAGLAFLMFLGFLAGFEEPRRLRKAVAQKEIGASDDLLSEGRHHIEKTLVSLPISLSPS